MHPSLKSFRWVNLQECPEDEEYPLIQKHNQATMELNKRSYSLLQSLKFGLQITDSGQGKKIKIGTIYT